MSSQDKRYSWVILIPLLLGFITFAATVVWIRYFHVPENNNTTLLVPTAVGWWPIWMLLFCSFAPRGFFEGEKGQKILEVLSARTIMQARIQSLLAALLLGGILVSALIYQ